MKRIQNLRRTAILAISVIFCTGMTYAQRLKIKDNKGIEDAMASSTQTITNIALLIAGAVLAIGLISSIYKVANGINGSKEAIIGWLAGVILYGLAVSYILNVV